MSSYTCSSCTYSESAPRANTTPKLTPMHVDKDISRGISFKQFLMHTLRLKDDKFTRNLSRARQWLSDPSVDCKFNDFKSKVHSRDALVTQSFVDFGNAILEIAMKDDNVPEEQRIKMLLTPSTGTDEVIPDVSIVHVNVDEDNIIQSRRLDWRRILGGFQVWYAKKTTSKKRGYLVTDSASDEPPLKRSKSPTSKELASSIQQPGCLDNRSKRSDRHSDSTCNVSTHPTTPTRPSSSSRNASESTLCEESAEGELVGSFSSMFSFRGDRVHAMGACLYGSIVKLMLASHTGIIESNEVDLVEEPELFVIFLTSFATSSFADIGFNSKTGFCNPCNVDDIVTRRLDIQFETCSDDNNQETQPCLDNVHLGTKIVSHKGLVDRSTSVYRLENANYAVGLVLKYSWQVKTHRREDTMIREARQADPLHTPELFGTAVVNDPSPFETLRDACSRKSKGYKARELRVLVMRRYYALASLGFGDEFWDAFAQLLGCAHELYRKKELLHHDISMKNLAYYRDEDRRPIAVLIDFDLAIMPPFENSDNKERIGTVAFMACELLDRPDVKYGLHHDYESFFYCTIWHGVGYEISEKYPCEKGSSMDILYDWRVGDCDLMSCYKYALTPKHRAFSLMLDEKFSKKCLDLWKVFDRTLTVIKEETCRRMRAGRFEEATIYSGDIPGSKVTYPMLMGALGSDVSVCGEECCI